MTGTGRNMVWGAVVRAMVQAESRGIISRGHRDIWMPGMGAPDRISMRSIESLAEIICADVDTQLQALERSFKAPLTRKRTPTLTLVAGGSDGHDRATATAAAGDGAEAVVLPRRPGQSPTGTGWGRWDGTEVDVSGAAPDDRDEVGLDPCGAVGQARAGVSASSGGAGRATGDAKGRKSRPE